jgi:hypothetical protein
MALFVLGCIVIANGFEKEMIYALLIMPLFFIGKPAFACFSKK